jgi:hypothetical protein
LRARDATADGPENACPRRCHTPEKAPAVDSIRIYVFDDSLDQCLLPQFRRQRAALVPARWLL